MTDTRPGVPVPAPAPPRTYAPRAAVPIRTGIPRRIDIADVTPNNVGQLRKLNSVLFPVRFSERWYKDVLEAQVADVSKFGVFAVLPLVGDRCRGKEGMEKVLTMFNGATTTQRSSMISPSAMSAAGSRDSRTRTKRSSTS